MLLGVLLDENLTWKQHIANVARKISKATGIIYGGAQAREKRSGAPWVRFFGKSIHARNFGYDVTFVRRPVQTVGVELGRQDSL